MVFTNLPCNGFSDPRDRERDGFCGRASQHLHEIRVSAKRAKKPVGLRRSLRRIKIAVDLILDFSRKLCKHDDQVDHRVSE